MTDLREPATNNKAEITACILAIALARHCNAKSLTLNTDSKFVINCITKWIPLWEKREWKTTDGRPVKNKELLEELNNLCKGFKIHWQHVKGHSGIFGNDWADKLATEAIS